jgi:uncharacterized phage protein (TIGR02220 family)
MGKIATLIESGINDGLTYVEIEELITILINKRKKKLTPQWYQESVEVLNYLNQRLGKKHTYKLETVPNKFVEIISARINEGNTLDKIKAVVWFKTKQWLRDATMKKYLRPDTLFNRSKFTNYVFELPENYNPDNSKAQRAIITELNKFGMRGIKNDETDSLAKELIKAGYEKKDFLNMFLKQRI